MQYIQASIHDKTCKLKCYIYYTHLRVATKEHAFQKVQSRSPYFDDCIAFNSLFPRNVVQIVSYSLF